MGSGIGLVSEAIAACKDSKAEKEKAEAQDHVSPASQAHSSDSATSRSREPSPNPPAYSTFDPTSNDYGLFETADEEHALQSFGKGHA